ncbi:MAG: hypothetical protein JWL90_891 [Chthoniobacteraceae bacterium]|nr:hypothetical protein [Chthoniobacteraceae bacterium]
MSFIAASAFAAGPITADVKPVAGRARSRAPQSLDITLTVQGASLLEGVLEVEWSTDLVAGYRYRSQELALSAGPRSLRVMLPAILNGAGDESSVQLRFVTKERLLDLGRFQIGLSSRASNTVTICIGKPLTGSGAQPELWQALRFEPVMTETAASTNRWVASFITTPVYRFTEDLGTDPLAYCGYDMLWLDGASLAELKVKQLAAIESWLRAGGSLCVRPGSGLKVEHVEFLNRIASGHSFAPGENGSLVWSDPPEPRLVSSGLGRLVVLPPGKSDTLETAGWNQVLAFLWKKQTALPEQKRFYSNIESSLMESLMSKSVHLIPRGVLFCLAGGFLLAIGPLDYFILGKLRRRRLTWILFPVVAVAFTGLTIWLAGRALGGNSQRASLIITDIAPDGKVVRESRFEMIFAAAVQEIASEGRNALFAPMRGSGMYHEQGRSAHGPLIEGQFPAHYTFRRTLQQWSPEMTRYTSIGPADDSSGLPWDQIAAALDLPLKEKAAALAQWDALGGHWELNSFAGSQPDLFDQERGGKWILSPFVIRQLCIPYPQGIMGQIFQASPSGSGSYEDCALIDANDSALKVITATRREGDNIHLFRRVYHQ